MVFRFLCVYVPYLSFGEVRSSFGSYQSLLGCWVMLVPWMEDRGECWISVEDFFETGEVVEEGAIEVQPGMLAALGDP